MYTQQLPCYGNRCYFSINYILSFANDHWSPSATMYPCSKAFPTLQGCTELLYRGVPWVLTANSEILILLCALIFQRSWQSIQSMRDVCKLSEVVFLHSKLYDWVWLSFQCKRRGFSHLGCVIRSNRPEWGQEYTPGFMGSDKCWWPRDM